MEPHHKILNGAEELFMRYGIKSVTMDDVASKLCISKKTLYQFVNNKADLIGQVIHLHLANELAEVEAIRKQSKDSVDEILNLARYVTQFLRELNPSTVYDLKKYYKDAWGLLESLHLQQVYTFIKTNLEMGIEQGLYRSDLDTDIIARLYGTTTIMVVDEKIFPLKEYNKEQLFEEYIQYHIRGIASAKGLKRLHKYLNP